MEFPDTVTVNVTKGDEKGALRMSATDCPIARAVKRALNMSAVTVSREGEDGWCDDIVRVYPSALEAFDASALEQGPPLAIYRMPTSATSYSIADSGAPKAPFTFEMTLVK